MGSSVKYVISFFFFVRQITHEGHIDKGDNLMARMHLARKVEYFYLSRFMLGVGDTLKGKRC